MIAPRPPWMVFLCSLLSISLLPAHIHIWQANITVRNIKRATISAVHAEGPSSTGFNGQYPYLFACWSNRSCSVRCWLQKCETVFRADLCLCQDNVGMWRFRVNGLRIHIYTVVESIAVFNWTQVASTQRLTTIQRSVPRTDVRDLEKEIDRG